MFIRTNRKLNITATSKIPNTAHHLDGHIAHFLIGRITQGHRRSHGYGISSMDSHRVHVLNRTNDDYIIIFIAQ